MLMTFTKNQDHFKQLSFVAAAVSKDETKPALRHIYVSESGDVVATDGVRLHMYTPEELPLEPGYWSINKCNKSELQLVVASEDLPPYPDYKRVVPEVKDLKLFNTQSAGGRLAIVIRAMGTHALNLDYFQAAARPSLIDSYQVVDGPNPVLFSGDCVRAVVMPTRI